MGQPYSEDLRERVVGAIEGGMSTGEAAKRFCVSKAAAGAWARLKRATGSVAPARQGKPPGSVLDAHADFIFDVIAAAPDTTLEEMADRLARERGLKVVYKRCGSSSTGAALRIKKDRSRERARAP